MRVASFCPLPLGVVAWEAAEPMLTVVVKATYSLARDGEAQLAAEQDPLRLDVPDPQADAGGLLYPTDFAPKKAHADVLLVGHAHAARPSVALRARLVADSIDRSFVARAVEPTTRVPLVARHLRASEAPSAPAVLVGPRSPWAPERISQGDVDFLAPDGALTRPLGDAFDYVLFNAAPPEQQLSHLRLDAALVLEGLLAGAPIRRAWLPGQRPLVFVLDPGERATEVPLVVDTLLIDTDRAVCALTWRGAFVLARGAPAPAAFVLAFERRDGPAITWGSLRRDLGAATWRRVETRLTALDAATGGDPLDRTVLTGDAATLPAVEAASFWDPRGLPSPTPDADVEASTVRRGADAPAPLFVPGEHGGFEVDPVPRGRMVEAEDTFDKTLERARPPVDDAPSTGGRGKR